MSTRTRKATTTSTTTAAAAVATGSTRARIDADVRVTRLGTIQKWIPEVSVESEEKWIDVWAPRALKALNEGTDTIYLAEIGDVVGGEPVRVSTYPVFSFEHQRNIYDESGEVIGTETETIFKLKYWLGSKANDTMKALFIHQSNPIAYPEAAKRKLGYVKYQTLTNEGLRKVEKDLGTYDEHGPIDEVFTRKTAAPKAHRGALKF